MHEFRLLAISGCQQGFDATTCREINTSEYLDEKLIMLLVTCLNHSFVVESAKETSWHGIFFSALLHPLSILGGLEERADTLFGSRTNGGHSCRPSPPSRRACRHHHAMQQAARSEPRGALLSLHRCSPSSRTPGAVAASITQLRAGGRGDST